MIAIGCDHGALDLKNQLIEHLKKRGIECKDTGCYTNESCDYPVYAKKVTALVTGGECELGILLCGTGIGMSIAANKVKGIRAAMGKFFLRMNGLPACNYLFIVPMNYYIILKINTFIGN